MTSIFDVCAGGGESPATYMDYELERESRIKMHSRRRKMDVIGTAMDMAITDIKVLVGMYSDNEEATENDIDYMDMNQLK